MCKEISEARGSQSGEGWGSEVRTLSTYTLADGNLNFFGEKVKLGEISEFFLRNRGNSETAGDASLPQGRWTLSGAGGGSARGRRGGYNMTQ